MTIWFNWPADLEKRFKRRVRQRTLRRTLQFEWLERRRLLALDTSVPAASRLTAFAEIEPNQGSSSATALPLVTGVALQTLGSLNPGDVDFFKFQVGGENQRLKATVHASGLDTRLSLFNTDGRLLIQSEAQTKNNQGRIAISLDDSIDQHLTGTSNGKTYLLKVEPLGNSSGNYVLTTELASSIAPFQSLNVGKKPSGVVVADFNGDAILDLAVTNNRSDSVTVLIGLGDGTFQSQGDAYQVGVNPEGIAAGDLNRDLHMDLAVVNETSDSVSVLFGDGAGRFTVQPQISVGRNMRPSTIVIGHFNNDNDDQVINDSDWLDIATSNEASGADSVSILFQNSSGGFEAKPVELDPNPEDDTNAEKPEGLVTGDFNGDGKPDFATVNTDSGTVSIGFGTGTKTPNMAKPFKVGKNELSTLVAVHLNGDNLTDLVVGAEESLILLTAKLNPLPHFDQVLISKLDFNPEVIVTKQLNDDDKNGVIDVRDHPDLIVADEDAQKLVVLLGKRSQPNKPFEIAGTFRVRGTPESLAAGDFDGDGRVDLVTGLSNADKLSLHFGLGGAEFTKDVSLPIQGELPTFVTSGDFNRDGLPDLVTANNKNKHLSLRLGRGDGTFSEESAVPLPGNPESLSAFDFDGDDRLDLAVAIKHDNQLLILSGLGDGRFKNSTDPRGDILQISKKNLRPSAGEDGQAIVTGQFNDDNGDTLINDRDIPDLAVANSSTMNATVLLGRSRGGFADIGDRYDVGPKPISLIRGQLNDDNGDKIVNDSDVLDLIVGNKIKLKKGTPCIGVPAVTVLLGSKTGEFTATKSFQLPGSNCNSEPAGLAIVESILGEKLIAIADATNEEVFFLTTAAGTLQRLSTSVKLKDAELSAIVAGHFNDDTRIDLAVTEKDNDFVFLLLQSQDGSFVKSERTLKVGESPESIIADDFDADGDDDIVTGNRAGLSVSFLENHGNGIFEEVAKHSIFFDKPDSLVAGQFTDDNDDQRIDALDTLDIAVANRSSDTSIVLQGDGTGKFDAIASSKVSIGDRPDAIAIGQFNDDNGDGRYNGLDLLDIAVANRGSDVSVIYGSEENLFDSDVRVALADQAEPIVVGDFDGDGLEDVATANITSNDVSIALQQTDRSFGEEIPISVGAAPQALIAGHFNDDNGDGRHDRKDRLDLAVVNRSDDNVSILLQRPRNECPARVCFRETRIAVGDAPVAIVAGQFNNDRVLNDDFLDLVVANLFDNSISVLLNNGSGGFNTAFTADVGTQPTAVVVAQFSDDNADGRIDGADHLDLAVANRASNDLSILLGDNNGQFNEARTIATGLTPVSIATDDWNQDGLVDLALSNLTSAEITLFLGLGNGDFAPQDGGGFSNQLAAMPLYEDLDGDTFADAVLLDLAGNILFRKGVDLTSSTGAADISKLGIFDPPAVINVDFPVQSIAIVTDSSGEKFLAAIDKAAIDKAIERLSFYRVQRSGQETFWTRIEGPALGRRSRPSEIASADFNQDGRGDLVVSLANLNQVRVFITGGVSQDFFVGNGASDLTLSDNDGDGDTDIFVANQVSGDISLLRNDGQGSFLPEQRYRTNTSVHALTDLADGTAVVTSRDRAGSLVVGDFNSDGRPDVLVSNAGVDSITLLLGTEFGGLSDPVPALSGVRTRAMHVARFNRDAFLDVALFDEKTNELQVYLGDGTGKFLPEPKDRTPTDSIGLVAFDISGPLGEPDQVLDLVVGNQFGDLLIRVGNGDGSFRDFVSDENVVLDVADLNFKETRQRQNEFVFSSRAENRVFVNDLGQNLTFQTQTNLLAPADIRVADMNGDFVPDLVFANSGKNTVGVLIGAGNGSFPEKSVDFPVGTRPVGITIAELNGDEWPDVVVANEGSNDLSILFGTGKLQEKMFENGPRLRAGSGPVATSVGNYVNANDPTDRFPDILVANSRSNNVFLIRGIRNGTFADKAPPVFTTGATPLDVFVGDFTFDGRLDFVTINFNSNDLSFFSAFTSSEVLQNGVSIPSQGDGPAAAVLDDEGKQLLVAHNRDGRFTVLEASLPIPRIVGGFTNPLVPHPTSVDRGSPEVYGVNAGGDRAELLFKFSRVTGPPLSTTELLRFTEGSRLVIARNSTSEFTTLSGASQLPLVPTTRTTLVAAIQEENQDQFNESQGEDNAENQSSGPISDRIRRQLDNLIMGLEEALEELLLGTRETARPRDAINQNPEPGPGPSDQHTEDTQSGSGEESPSAAETRSKPVVPPVTSEREQPNSADELDDGQDAPQSRPDQSTLWYIEPDQVGSLGYPWIAFGLLTTGKTRRHRSRNG